MHLFVNTLKPYTLVGLLRVTFVACFLAALTWHLPSVAEKNNTQPTQTILVFGDSLSAAYGIDQQLGWTALLTQKLNGFSQTHTFNVVNASVSGETTSGGLSRFQQAILRAKPSIVILELGANDGLRGLPVDLMTENLANMIQISQKNNAKVLLLGMKIPPNYGAKYAAAFEKMYINLSEHYKTALVPFMLENVAGKPELIQPDGLHPTATAQVQLLDNIWPKLSPLLGVH